MVRSTRRRVAGAIPVVLALVSLLACTSAGDGGVTGTNDYLNRGVTLTPDATSALSYVSLREVSGDAATSCIAVEARRVSDVFSAAFTITYDPALLRYTGFDASGSCLGTGAIVLPPQVDSTTTPGSLVVGLTRNAATTSVGSDTCAVDLELVILCFDVIGEGEFDMDFVPNLALLKPDNTPVDDLLSNWIGAHVVVRQ